MRIMHLSLVNQVLEKIPLYSYAISTPAKKKGVFKTSDEVIAVFGLVYPTTSPTNLQIPTLAIPVGWTALFPIVRR
jgi:hypothetical protein